uniref:Secreted protein n=1 Tax=Anguilla anguilla TaxID=7936 RepID=A0A0E9W6Y4_ANGAN
MCIFFSCFTVTAVFVLSPPIFSCAKLSNLANFLLFPTDGCFGSIESIHTYIESVFGVIVLLQDKALANEVCIV